MTAIGGAPESIALDGTEYEVAADADVGALKGGQSNEVLPNGGGGVRIIKRRMTWRLENVPVVIDRAQDDLGRLQALANGLDVFPVAITWGDGIVEQGVGQIEGEIVHTTGSAIATITLKGGGELTQQ